MKEWPNAEVRVTPTGILAEAFSRLVAEAEEPKAWWRTSPLLAGLGLAHHLDELGYLITPKTQDESES